MVVYKASQKESEKHPASQLLRPSAFSVHRPCICEVWPWGLRGWESPTEWEDIRGWTKSSLSKGEISWGAETHEGPDKKQQTLPAFQTELHTQMVTQLTCCTSSRRASFPALPGESSRKCYQSFRSWGASWSRGEGCGIRVSEARHCCGWAGAVWGCRDAPLDCGERLSTEVNHLCLPLTLLFLP